MKIITIEIPGNPISKARPRFARRGKFTTTYNPGETEEGKFLLLAREQIGKVEPMKGPIRIECCFYIKRPKSHYRTGKNSWKLKQSSPKYPSLKPDIDNLLKFVFDSLNGHCWVDDAQIVYVVSEKCYTKEYPRTTVCVYELTN